MKRNLKYIIPAILFSLVMAVSVGYSIWIILSETVSSYVRANGTLEFQPTAGSFYAGETWTVDGENQNTAPGKAVYTYKDGEKLVLYGTFTMELVTTSAKTQPISVEECTLTFTPSNLIAKWVWGETVSFVDTYTFAPVAQIGSTYYTTIDAALGAVTSGTIYAIPTDYATETGRANIAKTITPVFEKNENGTYKLDTDGNKIEVPREIPSGVTLCLPYDPTMDTLTSTQPLDGTTTDFTSTYWNKSTYCTNVVTVNSTLNVIGKIEICATLNTPNAYSIAGTTHGQYALVKLGETGSLDVYGEAVVLGYLEGRLDGRDKQSSYDAIEFYNDSTLQVSFSFYEFRNGTQTIHMVGSVDMRTKLATMLCCPFYRYFLPNVVGGYTVHKTANVGGLVSLNINNTLINPVIPMIGGTSSHFIQMTGNAGYTEIYYDPNARVMLGEGDSAYSDIYGTAYWSINGGAKINMLRLPISMTATDIPLIGSITINMTVTSNDVYFPIPYGLEIELANGTYDISTQDVKIQPGGRFVIGEGADVTARNVMVATTPPPVEGDVNTKQVPYPTAAQLKAAGRPETGECVIQSGGKLKVTAGCGEFLAGGAGAILNVQGVSPKTSLELYGASQGTGTVAHKGGYILTGTLHYVEHTATTFPFTIDKVSGGTYEVKGNYYSAQTAGANTPDDATDDTYAWYDSTFTVSFDANGGAFENGDKTATFSPSDSSYDGHVPLPEKPTRMYYTFSHWCTNKDCKGGPDSDCNVFDENGLSKNTYFTTPADPFYAIWTPITYTVNFAYKLPDGRIDDDCGIDTIEFNIENYSNLVLPAVSEIPNPGGEESPFTHLGWILNNAYITTLDAKNCADLAIAADSTSVTVYAEWSAKTYLFSFNMGENPHGLSYTSIENAAGFDPTTVPELVACMNGTSHEYKSFENSTLSTHYFGGWYLNAACTTEYTPAYEPAEGVTDVVLYAKWIPKVSITYTSSIEGAYADMLRALGYDREYAEYWYVSGTTVTLPDVDSRDAMHKEWQYYFISWTQDGSALATDTGSLTLSANTEIQITWGTKALLTVDYDTNNLDLTNQRVYVVPGVPQTIANVTAGDSDLDNSLYFDEWTLSNCVIDGTTLTVDAGATEASASASWSTKHKIDASGVNTSNLNSCSVTVSINNGDAIDLLKDSDKTIWVIPTDTVVLTTSAQGRRRWVILGYRNYKASISITGGATFEEAGELYSATVNNGGQTLSMSDTVTTTKITIIGERY